MQLNTKNTIPVCSSSYRYLLITGIQEVMKLYGLYCYQVMQCYWY